jgi:LemA protein
MSHDQAPTRGAISKGCAVLLALAGVVALFAIWLGASYNGLVQTQLKTEQSWAQVENQYKRRFDLIPNLVETVKGASDFERSTLAQVTEARAAVGRAQLPAELPKDPAALDAYIRAQQGLSAALGRLFAVAENYPQLRATESFLSLQDELAGTENRIAVARDDYTRAILAYNTKVRSFPSNLLAGLFGFETLPQLSVPAEEQATPKVDFGK